MRYDETSSWGNEDEQTDEAEFQELRKRLQVLQKSVAAVNEPLYVEILSNVVGNTLQQLDQQGGRMDWRDLDLALHEMYLFGELTVPNGGLYAKSQPSSVAAERLITMMSKMVDSGKLGLVIYIVLWLIFPRHCNIQPSCYPATIHGNMRPVLDIL
jgi:exportin-T